MTTSVFTACVDDINVGNAFLEKAPGVDVNIDTVFSKAEYTRNFLWSAYGQLYCTYTSGNMMNGAPIDVLPTLITVTSDGADPYRVIIPEA